MNLKQTRLATLAILLLIGLAGCSGTSGDGSGTSNPTSGPTSSSTTQTGTCPAAGCNSPPPHTWPARLEFNDCMYYSVAVQGDDAKMQGYLPQGYTPAPQLLTTHTIGADLVSCRSAILDNATVIPNPMMSMVSATVNVPSDVHVAGLVDVYLFEIVVNNATLQARWIAAGFPAKLGTFDLSFTDNTFDGKVSVDGTAYFQHQSAGRLKPESPGSTSSGRYHYSDGANQVWNNLTFSIQNVPQTPSPALTTATGGILPLITTSAQGKMDGTLSADKGNLVLEFGKKK